MKGIPPRTKVSEKTFSLVLSKLKETQLTPGMKGFKRGEAGQIIFLTDEGEIPCMVKEDDKFIIFEMPSGKNDLGVPKKGFTEQL